MQMTLEMARKLMHRGIKPGKYLPHQGKNERLRRVLRGDCGHQAAQAAISKMLDALEDRVSLG